MQTTCVTDQHIWMRLVICVTCNQNESCHKLTVYVTCNQNESCHKLTVYVTCNQNESCHKLTVYVTCNQNESCHKLTVYVTCNQNESCHKLTVYVTYKHACQVLSPFLSLSQSTEWVMSHGNELCHRSTHLNETHYMCHRCFTVCSVTQFVSAHFSRPLSHVAWKRIVSQNRQT